MTHAGANLVQVGYRIRSGDTVLLNANAGGDWAAALNTPVDFDVDVQTVLRVRLAVEENGGAAGTVAGVLEYDRNSTGFVTVTTSSSVIRAIASGQFNEGDATTDLAIGGAGGFVAGSGCEDGDANDVSLTSQHTEIEYILQIQFADVADNDTIDLRINGLNSYTQTARITITKMIGGVTLDVTPDFPAATLRHQLPGVTLDVTPDFPVATLQHRLPGAALDVTPDFPVGEVTVASIELTGVTLDVTPDFPVGLAATKVTGVTLDIDPIVDQLRVIDTFTRTGSVFGTPDRSEGVDWDQETAATGAVESTTGSVGQVVHSSPGDSANSQNERLQLSMLNVEIKARFRIDKVPTGANISVNFPVRRKTDGTNNMYRLNMDLLSTGVLQGRWTRPGSGITNLFEIAASYTPNTWYWFRALCFDNPDGSVGFLARWWEDGSGEPTIWQSFGGEVTVIHPSGYLGFRTFVPTTVTNFPITFQVDDYSAQEGGFLEHQLTGVVLDVTPDFPIATLSLPGTITGVTLDVTPDFPAGSLRHELTGVALDITPDFPAARLNLQGVTLDVTPTLETATLQHRLTGVVLDITPDFPAGEVEHQVVGATLDVTPLLDVATLQHRLTGAVLDITPDFPAGSVKFALLGATLDVTPTLDVAALQHRLTASTLDVTPDFPVATITETGQIIGVTLDVTPDFPAGALQIRMTGVVLDVTPDLPQASLQHQVTGILLDVVPDFPAGSITTAVTLLGVTLDVDPVLPIGALSLSRIDGVTLDIDIELDRATIQVRIPVEMVVNPIRGFGPIVRRLGPARPYPPKYRRRR